jgi:hypothetical protein
MHSNREEDEAEVEDRTREVHKCLRSSRTFTAHSYCTRIKLQALCDVFNHQPEYDTASLRRMRAFAVSALALAGASTSADAAQPPLPRIAYQQQLTLRSKGATVADTMNVIFIGEQGAYGSCPQYATCVLRHAPRAHPPHRPLSDRATPQPFVPFSLALPSQDTPSE